MAKHHVKYRIYLNTGNFSYKVRDIFDEFGIDNCKIELIEEYPCESKMQLSKREGFHMQNTNCVNKRVEGQYLNQHEYWVHNKERLSELKSEKFVCDTCQGCYTRDHRSHHVKTLKHQNAVLQLRSNTPSV